MALQQRQNKTEALVAIYFYQMLNGGVLLFSSVYFKWMDSLGRFDKWHFVIVTALIELPSLFEIMTKQLKTLPRLGGTMGAYLRHVKKHGRSTLDKIGTFSCEKDSTFEKMICISLELHQRDH